MALPLEKYHVRLVLTERMLGTVPKDKEVFTSYLAGKDSYRTQLEAKRKDLEAKTRRTDPENKELDDVKRRL